jgi:alginate O-acetyltransferase complex protein AlgI
MSLSFWIRDYVFLPLAVAGGGAEWKLAALFLSMVIFGAWHGASLLFVIWGAYHGLLLVGHRLLEQWNRKSGRRPGSVWPAILSWALTLPLISLGWILFRSNSLHQAAVMLRTVLRPGAYHSMALQPNFYIITAGIVTFYFVVCGLRKFASQLESSFWRRLAWTLSPVLYAGAIVLIIVWSSQKSVFVYIQF